MRHLPVEEGAEFRGRRADQIHPLALHQALAQGERWGVRQEVQFPGGSITPGAVGTPWFLYTEGGPEGYDFRTPTATCAWDFDVDGGVGSSDLAQLLAGQGRRFRSQDVAQMLGSWGACEPSAP